MYYPHPSISEAQASQQGGRGWTECVSGEASGGRPHAPEPHTLMLLSSILVPLGRFLGPGQSILS